MPSDDASAEEAKTLMGEILAGGQVFVPVRTFVRDSYQIEFPGVRYEIRWNLSKGEQRDRNARDRF